MQSLLNDSLSRLQGSDAVASALAPLVDRLDASRRELSPAEWHRTIGAELRPHALYAALLEDPFVRHSAMRPRGYPGDAELLDYIYGSENIQPMIRRATALGRRLYRHSYSTPAPAAVRRRRALAAAEIDRIAARGGRPHILSVACGHLREARCLQALRNDGIGRFVALDQDSLSLDLVRYEWAHTNIEAVECSARRLMRSGLQLLGRYDFIYALGLYDYLSDEAGSRLLSALVDMLNPGGKVWIANFVEGCWSVGFMEAIMDWWLIYRSGDRLQSLSAAVAPAKIHSQRVFLEPAENVVFLELVRA